MTHTFETDTWEGESWSYFQRNYQGQDLRSLPPVSYLDALFQAVPLELGHCSILDIGCGPGTNLFYLYNRLGAARGVGTEPSRRVVDVLCQVFPELEFEASDSRSLPYSTGEFDLVLLRSVLHWVDRNYLLQTVGEAIRVCKRYLIVSDFTPHQAYSTDYHHRPGWRTWKIDFRPIVESCGFMRCLASLHSHDGDEWNGVQTCLFRKMDVSRAYPFRTQPDVTTLSP